MIGWRAHLGAIFPTPIPARVIREFYDVVPEGVDITISSLTIRQLTVEDLEEALGGLDRAAEQMARFEVDLVYFLGVPPVVIKGPGYDREVIARLERASGKPAGTDIAAVMEAFRTSQPRASKSGSMSDWRTWASLTPGSRKDCWLAVKYRHSFATSSLPFSNGLLIGG